MQKLKSIIYDLENKRFQLTTRPNTERQIDWIDRLIADLKAALKELQT